MRTLGRVGLAALLLVALAAPFAALGRAQDKQPLAEIARESKRKKEESTRRVWTNDDLGTALLSAPALPSIRILRKTESPPSLAPFVPSSESVVEAMLRLAEVQPGEVVFDIGSGDGRIVIAAAEQFGALGVGIEIDEALVERSRRTIQERGLEERVRIIHANALDVDLSPADVVTLYLTAEGMKLLKPHLEGTLRPGTRVVSHAFAMPEWTPERAQAWGVSALYLYRVP